MFFFIINKILTFLKNYKSFESSNCLLEIPTACFRVRIVSLKLQQPVSGRKQAVGELYKRK